MRSSTISALHAVSAAHGSDAASSSVRWSGTLATPSALRQRRRVSTPSTGPPIVSANFSGAASPPIQLWKNIGHARSPTATRRTPAPTATTSPTPSDSGISGSLTRGP